MDSMLSSNGIRPSPGHLHSLHSHAHAYDHASTDTPTTKVDFVPSDFASVDDGDWPASYKNQLADFRLTDQKRESFMNGIIKRLLEAERKTRQLERDVESERMSRSHYQERYTTARADFDSLKSQVDGNKFVAVLVDGDGAIFQDAFIKLGASGGSDAAGKLLTAVRAHLASNGILQNVPIVVQIFCNLEGLSRHLVSSGHVSSSSDLANFSRGFNMHKLCSFVDVGHGKERADYKVREAFEFYFSNMLCQEVILAASHDNGYLPMLQPLSYDNAASRRITLLETLATQPAFEQLPFARVAFSEVFRSSSSQHSSGLDNPSMAPPVREALPSRFVECKSPTSSTGEPAHYHTGGVAIRDASGKVPSRASPEPATGSSPKQSAVSPTLSAGAPPPSYAAASRQAASGSAQISISRTKPVPVPRRFYLCNSDHRRLDEKLDRPTPEAVGRLEDRLRQGVKYCNAFHLNKNCSNTKCQYVHGDALKPMERLALRQKARGTPCKAGSMCQELSCTCGHVCQGMLNDGRCTRGASCLFANTHDYSYKPTIKLYENNTSEMLD